MSGHTSIRYLRRAELVAVGALVAFAAAVGAAGCGGNAAPPSAVRLDAAADGSLRFDRSALSVAAGSAAIEMGNPSDIPHAIGVRGGGLDLVGATAGRDGLSRVEADLEPGVYELFCPVGGHERAGMTAKLMVR